MMPILLDIPAYAGGYRMDADALQAQIIDVRDGIVNAVLSYEERMEIQRAQYAIERWTIAEIQEAQLVRVQELLPTRLDRKDWNGWTVRELLAEFERLSVKIKEDYGHA